jgi:hypothetical protein
MSCMGVEAKVSLDTVSGAGHVCQVRVSAKLRL